VAVRGGHDDHGAAQALRPQVLLDEFADLAAPLADQADHVDVGLRVARDHPQENALPHAGAGEDAHLLALAAGQQAVEHADAEIHGLHDPPPLQGVDRLGIQRVVVLRLDGAPAVDGVAQAVDDPPQELLAHGDGRLAPQRDDLAARAHALQVVQRHEEDLPLAEPDHLGAERFAGAAVGEDVAHLAHGARGAVPLDHEADDLAHRPVDLDRVDLVENAVVAVEVQGHENTCGQGLGANGARL